MMFLEVLIFNCLKSELQKKFKEYLKINEMKNKIYLK